MAHQEHTQEKDVPDMNEKWSANEKVTYDGYRSHDWSVKEKLLSEYLEAKIQARKHAEDLHTGVMQMMWNVVNTTNKDQLQSTKHADLAMDRMWNISPAEGVGNAVIVEKAREDVDE